MLGHQVATAIRYVAYYYFLLIMVVDVSKIVPIFIEYETKSGAHQKLETTSRIFYKKTISCHCKPASLDMLVGKPISFDVKIVADGEHSMKYRIDYNVDHWMISGPCYGISKVFKAYMYRFFILIDVLDL